MENKKTQLPENAHRELKPGEEYQPLLSPQKNYPEVTFGNLYGPTECTEACAYYNVDREYAASLGEQIGRGWDSTVWQKVYENGEEKYVMIAELNTVVPTFDI